MPPKLYKRQKPKVSQLSDLSDNDLILHTTRPAMNDDKKNDRRWLFKSGLELENIIFQNMKKFFIYCNRQYIILSKEIKYDGDYRAIKFNLKTDSHIACNANVEDQLSLERISQKKMLPNQIRLLVTLYTFLSLLMKMPKRLIIQVFYQYLVSMVQ